MYMYEAVGMCHSYYMYLFHKTGYLSDSAGPRQFGALANNL